MRFKSLEVTGFKSFADKTKIYFQPGITSIVGPNGCGKSNISDAIRWVLGEQSAKQIRGERMEDVIFNGTGSRAPMGMAEVTLVITDIDPGISPDFGAFEEIQITRRYYRSGESEYLINRIPCRLSDIRELFMDTGLGAKAYSIIGQESISSILNAKPRERRFLFEEAAGISKYKSRKEEALRKLSRTRENLSRVRDIIAEVARQRNSLDRQAKKAERYKNYKKEIQELDLFLSALEYADLKGKGAGLEQEYQTRKTREAEILSHISSKETRIEDLELQVLDLEKDLRALQDGIRGIETDISRRENRVEILKENISHFRSISEGSNREIQRLEEGIQTTRTATENLQKELQRVSQTMEESEEQLREREEEHDALSKVQEECEQNAEEKRSLLTDLMRRVAIQKNRIENHLRERETLLNLHKDSKTMRADLEVRLTRKEEQQRSHAGKLRTLLTAVETKRAEQARILQTLEEREAELASVLEQLSRIREQAGQGSSRLSTLVELQESMEGYDKGVRSLLQTSRNPDHGDGLPVFHSLVAEIFETDPRFEVAIESALNSQYQSLVVDSPEEALRAVDHLRENRIGRGCFIPLAPRNTERTPFVRAKETGVVGEALDLVRYDARFRGVAEHLLGDVVVMENLEQAVALFRRNGFQRTLVTLHGEILHPSGTVEGGLLHKTSSGFIRRKREIRELRISLQALQERLRQSGSIRDRLSQEITNIKKKLRETSSELQALDSERVQLEKEETSLAAEAAHLRQKMEGLSQDYEARSSKLLAVGQDLTAMQNDLSVMEREQMEQQSSVSRAMEKINSLRRNLVEKRKEITEERVRIASLQEKSASIRSHIEKNQSALQNIRNLIESRKRESEDAKIQLDQTHEEKESTEALILTLIERKEERSLLFAQKQDTFETLRSERDAEQKEFRALRYELDQLRQVLNEVEVRKTELSIKMDHLQSRIREKYQQTIEECYTGYLEQSIDPATGRNRLEELKRKIDQMGPVNITAIEEYNALQERFEFLTAQEADLQESVDILMSTIRKINRTSKQRFLNAFDAINRQFQKVFQELFQGGHAELRLEEGEDVLDAGVEIIAQPPGKKTQHLSLLSGGEKALAAIALIFAGFLVKPTPFCLLDEADAPLDDANVERYNELIKLLTRDTQFIVITHNKSTMEASDALYGITMQEPGISKMVSVRFNDGHEAQMSA